MKPAIFEENNKEPKDKCTLDVVAFQASEFPWPEDQAKKATADVCIIGKGLLPSVQVVWLTQHAPPDSVPLAENMPVVQAEQVPAAPVVT